MMIFLTSLFFAIGISASITFIIQVIYMIFDWNEKRNEKANSAKG